MSSKQTINAYRYGLSILIRRLLWDLRPKSWSSRKKIKSLKDKFKGKKAIIICNGPSLNSTDLSLLDGVYTFGLNKINLLFDRITFRSSCIVSVNPFVIEQNASYYNKTDIPLFLDKVATKHVRSRDSIYYLHSTPVRQFVKDCSLSIYQGYTVTFVAMQLAFHMGFKKIGLIGCDHNFATKGAANKTVVSGKEDPNHFDPNYFAGGQKWQLPDLLESEISYMMAKIIYQDDNREIINCTNGGKLEIFERQSIEDFLLKD